MVSIACSCYSDCVWKTSKLCEKLLVNIAEERAFFSSAYTYIRRSLYVKRKKSLLSEFNFAIFLLLETFHIFHCPFEKKWRHCDKNFFSRPFFSGKFFSIFFLSSILLFSFFYIYKDIRSIR